MRELRVRKSQKFTGLETLAAVSSGDHGDTCWTSRHIILLVVSAVVEISGGGRDYEFNFRILKTLLGQGTTGILFIFFK